uniref:MARVEL domain-containing protein n=1 Tax=Denticeps clupeoides TaxID=299321 RepID=A0AAY3ZYD4_9TELE
MEAGATGAYGVALAGGGFDPVSFLKRPQTVVRILGWVAAMVVFACITGEGYVNSLHDPQARCVFNKSDSACHYAVGVGIIAFLACMAFLLADAYMPFMSNAQDRKKIVAADLIFSGVWTFLWFVCFCLLANLWSKTTDTNGIPADAVHATVAFSFFSIAAFLQLRQETAIINQNVQRDQLLLKKAQECKDAKQCLGVMVIENEVEAFMSSDKEMMACQPT